MTPEPETPPPDKAELEVVSYADPTDFRRESRRKQVDLVTPRRRKRKARFDVPAWLVGLILASLAGAGVIIAGNSDPTVTSTPPPPPGRSPVDVEPTLPLVAELASPVVPEAYILALSATPPPTLIALEVLPTLTPTPLNVVNPTPVFSLATSRIVYVCYVNESDEICIMNADGTDIRQLTRTPGTDWYPSFSPDGNQIVFSSQRSGSFDIWVMDTNGENLVQLTRNHSSNYAPAFSPDGSLIIFASTAGGARGEQNIWMINADGSGLRQVTDSDWDDIDPTFSPDGSQITFASNRTGTTELFVMDLATGVTTQMTQQINIGGRNDWSPDGRWMTFYAGPRGDKNIYILDASCAYSPDPGCLIPPRLLVAAGNSKGPSFSPDSEWITFALSETEGDPDNEIYIVRVDGSALYKLTDNDIPDWQPRWEP